MTAVNEDLKVRNLIADAIEPWKVPYRYWLAESIMNVLQRAGWRIVKLESAGYWDTQNSYRIVEEATP